MLEKLYSNKTPGADLLADAALGTWGTEGPTAAQLQAIRFALRVYGGVPLSRDLPKAVIVALPSLTDWSDWVKNVLVSKVDTRYISFFPIKPGPSAPQRPLSNKELLDTLGPAPKEHVPTMPPPNWELSNQLNEATHTIARLDKELKERLAAQAELIGKLEAKPFLVRFAHPEPNRIIDCCNYHTAFPELLAAVGAGRNVMLVGPAGCGKSTMGAQAALALELEFDFLGAVSSEFKLSGFINANGQYMSTVYRRRFEHGGLLMLDEIDGSAAGALLYMNSGTAGPAQDFPDGTVRKHRNFRLVAAANTWGMGADRQYVGRNQLDAASLDRYYVMSIDYDEKLERRLFSATPQQAEWCAYVQAVRAECRTMGIRHVVSTRAIEGGIALFGTDVPREAIERAVLWRHLDANLVTRIKGALRA